MKNIILNLKIIWTNFSRILMSFLFINVGNFFGNKAHASMELSCYITGPSEDVNNASNFNVGNVFIIFVPIVIIAIAVISIIIRHKNKKKEKKNKDKKEDI